MWDNNTANTGNQHIELNAFEASAALLENVCLVNGETLEWSFYHKNRSGPADTVELQIGNNLQLLATQTTTSTTVWAQNAGSAVVAVPSGLYDLRFIATAPAGSLGNFLDDVSITLTPLLEFDLANVTETEGENVTKPQIVISGLVPAGGFTVPITIVPGGTTASPSDYTLASTVFIPPGIYDGGATSRFDIDITLTEDTEIEGDETVEVEVGAGAGYDIAPISCSGSAQTTAVYTIRDDDARLTLEKSVTNDSGGTSGATDWTLEFNGGAAGTAAATQGNAAITNAFISEGVFALSETGPSGYALSNLACSGAADTSTSVANPNVTIVPGELVTCSFTNDDIAPRLTLAKVVSGGTASIGDFTLSYSGPSGSASATSGSASITNVELLPGLYTLSETNVNSYDGVLSCSGAADTNPDDGLNLQLGEVVTCTFTNTFNPVFNFTISKTLDTGPTINLGQSTTITDAGDEITYSVVIENTGNSELQSFVLTDTLPGATVTCATSGNNTIALLARDASENCTITYAIVQSDFDTNGGGDGDIDNTIVAEADGGGSTVTRSDDEEVPITQVSDIDVSKQANDDTNVLAGQTVTYTYRVVNLGNTTVSSITLADVVTAGSGTPPTPGNETLATAGGIAVSTTTSDAAVDGSWDALGPGDAIEFTGDYFVTQSDIDTLQ